MHTIRMPKRIFCCVMALCILVLCCSSSLLMALAGAANTVYMKNGETYHAITGFEPDDTVTINVGSVATNIKNNGDRSHKFTVGNNTFISSTITLNDSYPLSDADYLQFWVKNATGTDQYLLGMNFQGNGFQYNVPAGKDAILIADGSTAEVIETWTNIRITGAGTIRSLLIPAGFSGYVRVSVTPEDLEVKVPSGATFDADTFDKTTKIGLLLGNTGTGGDIYMDDLGYIVAVASAVNTIYTKPSETYNAISGFEMGDAIAMDNSVADTNVKNNGFQSRKVTVGDNTFVSTGITLNGSHTLSDADYLQFWVKNAAGTDQYMLGMNFQGNGFQYNVPAGKDAILIADGSTVEVTETWTNIRINGAGTIRSLLIPAGFSGYVRVSVTPEDLEVKVPSGEIFDADTFNCTTKIGLILGNTATGGSIYFDDLGYIVIPNLPPEEPVQPSVNTIYTKPLEIYNAITGFETGDTVTVESGAVDNAVKNNGFQSHKVTLGDDTFVSTAISFNGSYPLSEAVYLQFWIKNAAGADQYLLGMNFQGNGFQYNVPAGKEAILIADGSTVEVTETWTNIRINGVGTTRSLLIPAGFSGYVRISVAPEDLEVKVPSGAAFDADAFDRTTKIGLILGNSATGGDIYMDDLGYIIDPNTGSEEEPVQPVTNTIYTKPTETYYAMSGFETGDTITIANGVVNTAVKNNGYQSQKVTVGNDTFISTTITLAESYPLSEARYLQFWVKNAAGTDQYLLGMNFQGNGFQYNVPAGKDAILIADGSTAEVTKTWTNIRITGAGTIRSLLIPAGFSGYVRVSVTPEDLEVKAPSGAAFDADTFDKTTKIGLLFGNTGTGGDVYLDDLGYIIDPNAGSGEEIIQPTPDNIYLDNGDTYHVITGFETNDVATVNVGSAATNVKNNGNRSHKFTVGDNTFISATITLNKFYPFSEVPYVQFWINNTAKTDQYLLSMSFQGDGFQYNVPAGVESFLIADGSTTETSVTWTNTKINGAGTIRSLLIPAGFSGYVRVSVAAEDLESKIGTYNADTFNKTKRIGIYMGNTAVGGDIYMDDLGYIANPNYTGLGGGAVESVSNSIYLEKGDTYHKITGFEPEDKAASSIGLPSIKIKNNGYQSHKYTIPDNGYTQTVLTLNASYPLSKVPYVQFWINNTAKTDQYLLSMSFQGDGFQYNVPTGAPAWLIADGKSSKIESMWESVKINGAGTIRSLLIPAGFSGYVRIPISPEYLAPTVGTYNASTIDKTTKISIYMGNTATGGELYFDDLGYIANPNYTGLGSGAVESVSNSIYVENGETYHEMTGFEADDRVASSAGIPGVTIKNNGYQSHMYTIPDDGYMKVELTLNDSYPLSTATYVQFWLNNSTKTDQYLLSMSFQGDGFQYNVPTGASALLIVGGKSTKAESIWGSVKINGAGTMRGLLIPAGFSGYVRIPVSLYDLQPQSDRYNASVFNETARIAFYLGNTATGGNLYLDDVGYITNANVAIPDYDAPGEFVKNDIFLNKGDSYHLITGFELDDATSVTPFDRQSHNVSNLKNNGHYSYRFSLQEANFLNARIKFPSMAEIASSEYLQFWISNPSNNNIYIFNPSFSDGNSFQYNIKDETNIFLIADGSSEPFLAQWSNPTLGTFKGRSFVIPVGFSGYVRLPLGAETMTVKRPTDGKFSSKTLATANQFTFYLGNIDAARYAYMDDVMLIDGKVMDEPEPDYSIDYSMDMLIPLYGQILDENGVPMKNVTLVLDEYAVTKTDSNGRFVFNGVSMDCHTLCVVDDAYKVLAQTAITIMPGEETSLKGTFISKRKDATALTVNMQMMGSGIKLVSVAEGELAVDAYVPNKGNAAEKPGAFAAIILWGSAGLGVILVALAVFLLIKHFRKKSKNSV